jgi:hypothetical protein
MSPAILPQSFPREGIGAALVSSRSELCVVRVRRTALMTGASALLARSRRMRRKAVTTCDSNQEVYSLRLWRCS